VKRNRTPKGRGDWSAGSDTVFEPLGRGRARFEVFEGPSGQLHFGRVPGTDRLVITEVRLTATVERPIDTELWRRVPLGYLEQMANLPEARSQLLGPSRNGVLAAVGPARPVRPRYRLPSRPSGGRYPDDFYNEVAGAYHWAVLERRAPAQTIADANDVPITTVHRWIREARRRGLLAPARAKGQPG
jgi:hypothetical protein